MCISFICSIQKYDRISAFRTAVFGSDLTAENYTWSRCCTTQRWQDVVLGLRMTTERKMFYHNTTRIERCEAIIAPTARHRQIVMQIISRRDAARPSIVLGCLLCEWNHLWGRSDARRYRNNGNAFESWLSEPYLPVIQSRQQKSRGYKAIVG